MDDQDERMIASSGEGKKKLVIVGGGWGVSYSRAFERDWITFFADRKADNRP